MFETAFSAAPYLYGNIAWEIVRPGPATLTGKAISYLLSGLGQTSWGASAVSPEFIRDKLDWAEYFGKKNLKSASILQNHALLAPYEYARTTLTIAARKAYFFINGQAISQTLYKRTAETIAQLAQAKKLSVDKKTLSTETARLGTFEEKVEGIFKEKSKELAAPTLSKAQLTAFSSQLVVENALPWIMRTYVAHSVATAISFDIPFVPTLLTVGFLWVYTNRLIPGVRNELVSLKAPKQSKPINLIDGDTSEAIEIEAIKTFKLDKELRDDKVNLTSFKKAVEDLQGKTQTNNPFLPLKSPAPSIKKAEAPTAKGKSWFSSLLSIFWSTDKKADIEKQKAKLKTKYHEFRAKEKAAPDGTPERFRATEKVQEVRRLNAELVVGEGEDDEAPEVVASAYIKGIDAGYKAVKLENKDAKAYLKGKLEEIQAKITNAATEEKFELCEQLRKVKRHVTTMQEKPAAVDLAKSTPVKSRKSTPVTTPRNKADTPRTTVRKAVDEAADALSSEEEKSEEDESKVARRLDLDSAATSGDESS